MSDSAIHKLSFSIPLGDGRPGFRLGPLQAQANALPLPVDIGHLDFDLLTEDGPERRGQDAAYVIDSTKARERFGWRPRVALADGVRECIDWIDANWPAIREAPHEYRHRP